MSALLIVDQFEKEFVEAAIRMDFAGVSYRPTITRQDLLGTRHKAKVLVVRSKVAVDEALLNVLPEVKLIIRAGAGLEQVDLEACTRRGVKVEATPGANAQSVGEHALGMLLMLLNHLHSADRQVRQGLWQREQNRGSELSGLTVGIIGYGHTGRALARVLYGFECQVLAYDKHRSAYGDTYAREATMADIFARSEVISLHVPLTLETTYLVDTPFLASFAKPIWLLNLSRGGVVDTAALLAALESGAVRGAGLDVLENEKLDTLTPEQATHLNALAARDNVVLTPHVGGWTSQSERRISHAVLDRLARFLQDQ